MLLVGRLAMQLASARNLLSLFFLLCWGGCATSQSNQAPENSWPYYTLQAEKHWQLNPPDGERFDASGPLLRKNADLPTLTHRGAAATLDALARGATDYVLKDKLGRLVPVIRRALQERAERIGASLTIVTAPRKGTEVVLAWEPPSFTIPRTTTSHGHA